MYNKNIYKIFVKYPIIKLKKIYLNKIYSLKYIINLNNLFIFLFLNYKHIYDIITLDIIIF